VREVEEELGEYDEVMGTELAGSARLHKRLHCTAFKGRDQRLSASPHGQRPWLCVQSNALHGPPAILMTSDNAPTLCNTQSFTHTMWTFLVPYSTSGLKQKLELEVDLERRIRNSDFLAIRNELQQLFR